MQLVYFTVVAIALYFLSDMALRGLESALGRRFAQRNLIFFAILLSSSLIVFWLIRRFLGQ